MFGAIKYNLSHLAVERSADARSTFWHYVLAVWIVRFIAAIAISLPITVRMTTIAVERRAKVALTLPPLRRRRSPQWPRRCPW